MLEGVDRERLLRRLRSGDINNDQFTDEVCNFALTGLTKRMQLHVPGLPSPDPNDFVGHLSNVFEFVNAVSSKDSESHKILTRAESAQELVDDIFDNWSKLRVFTYAHGEALAKRWTKRTVPKRKKIILEAWPGINLAHRPDFDVIRRNLKGPAHHDALMMPYINLEDLSFEKNLLEFMDSRSQVPPEYFAFSDSLPFKTAVSMEAVKPAAAYEQVMLLTGQKSRDTYGKLKTISVAEMENIVWTGYAFQLAQGIVILEIQQRLYRFLLRCAELLLHDIDIPQVVTDANTMDPKEHWSLASTLSLEPAEWQSVSKMNSQASYRLPRPFSLEFLQRLAGAQRDAAEDVFWALHEDPGLFQEHVTLLVQQSWEPCRRAYGAEDKARAYGAEDKVEPAARKQAGIHVVLDICHDIILWEAIDVDLRTLKTLKDSTSTNFQLSERLPPDYEKALERFMSLIFSAWHYAVIAMFRLVLASRNFIDFFEMDLDEEHMDFRLRESSTRPPVLDLLSDLQGIKKTNMMGALNILDEVERILESDAVQRGLVNTGLKKEISKLAALAQIHDALVRHQPTIQITSQDSDRLVRHQLDRLKLITDLEEHLTGASLGPYTQPTSAFVYPVGRKPTLERVEQMRRAEAKLDYFWDQVDNCKLKPRTGKTLLQWMGNRVTVRSVYRTQPWLPVIQEPIGSAPVQSAFQPFPDFTPQNIDKLPKEPRKKQKTKGETSITTEPTEPAEPSASSQAKTPMLPSFVLPRKIYKTITAFFPTSNQERISRKVLWKDFLHVMYGLGFQIQKRHGSEWYFEPSWKRNAPITIHEPHPLHEMRFDQIRFEANRMARKYDWSSETFVLAD